ncbi:MAG: hypothetical protein EA381_12990 [Planctomycetaceae bacterium]|nr:MAG: hypothetical protein EA381_12990 [Planctomycetaceae bacterium]
MSETLVGKLLIASTLVPESVFCRSVCLMVHHDENGAIGMLLNRPVVSPPNGLVQWLAETDPGDSVGVEAAEDDSADADPSPTGVSGTAKSSGSRLAKPASYGLMPGGSPTDPSGEPGGDDSGPGKTPEKLPNPQLGSVPSTTPADYAAVGTNVVHFGGPLSGPVVAIHGLRDFAEAEAGAGIYVATQRQILEQLIKQPGGEMRLVIGHAAWTNAQLENEFAAGLWHVLPATPETVLPTQVDPWPRLMRRGMGASLANWLGVADNLGRNELN